MHVRHPQDVTVLQRDSDSANNSLTDFATKRGENLKVPCLPALTMERQHRHEVLGTIDYWRRCKGALMTLVIGVATGDGLVLAADSRTTQALVDKPWRVLSDFTNKVFEVGRFAAATAGWHFFRAQRRSTYERICPVF